MAPDHQQVLRHLNNSIPWSAKRNPSPGRRTQVTTIKIAANFLLRCGNLQARPGWILMQTAPRLIALLFFALFALGSSARADDDATP